MDNVESVKQIFAKRSFLHHRLQAAVSGGDDTNINANGLVPADAFKLSLLQNTQQFGLQHQRHLTNFIKQ